jgi:Flp pilus assembly protein TadB
MTGDRLLVAVIAVVWLAGVVMLVVGIWQLYGPWWATVVGGAVLVAETELMWADQRQDRRRRTRDDQRRAVER